MPNHENAQCRIYPRNDTHMGEVLVSYATKVAEVKDDVLTVYGLYSATTRRHISWFMQYLRNRYNYRSDLATYRQAKDCAELGISVNLYNGDVKKIRLY